MKRAWLIPFLVSVVCGTASATTPRDLVTRAESSDFRATPSYEETLEYVRQLSGISPSVQLEFFGTSAQRRRLPVVIVSRDRAFTPAAAAATSKPVLLIQNGIHAGEIDGKDACLMILRDLALGKDPDVLDRLILLVVPIYNVDGHERVSIYNRPNQNGPVEGMGFRTTADGHDLNRDHVKLETPEARALIGLFNAWRPHLHVDNHVTDGCDHDWVLTYSWAEAPQVPQPIDSWLASHMPRVLEATEALGHRVGPYVSLVDRSDPAAGFDSVVGAPRLATGYYPLRSRPSILVENHSYKLRGRWSTRFARPTTAWSLWASRTRGRPKSCCAIDARPPTRSVSPSTTGIPSRPWYPATPSCATAAAKCTRSMSRGSTASRPT
jgi:hypothetical protein